MSTIIRRLPIDAGRVRLSLETGGLLEIPLRQLVVWVSLVPDAGPRFDPKTPRFPAIIDTGYGDNLAIREEDFRQFSGYDIRSFSKLREPRRSVRGRVHRREANLWLHGNIPGTRNCDAAGKSVHFLQLSNGIQVFERPGSEPDARPTLPLLSVKALLWNRLRLVLEGSKAYANISAPGWRFWR